MGEYYLLDDDHNLVPVNDVHEWARFFENHANRIVAQDYPRPNVLVSTVFLGVDHSFGRGSRPVVFETMVCRNGEWGEEQRYATWEEAEDGHAAMLKRVMEEDSQ